MRRFFLAAALCLFSFPSFAHGVFVVGDDPQYTKTPQIISVTNSATDVDAQAQAFKLCRQKNYVNCRLLFSFQNACASVFYGAASRMQYVATGDTPEDAQNKARLLCGVRSDGCNLSLPQMAYCDRTSQAVASNSQPASPSLPTSVPPYNSQPSWSGSPGLSLWLFLIAIAVGGYLFVKFVQNTSSQDQGTLESEQVNAVREKQIEALKAAVPKTPVKGMRATIQTNTFTDGRGRECFTVDMILELTETERGIIKEYELYEILLEDVPLYSKEELEERAYKIAQLERDNERRLWRTKGGMIRDQVQLSAEEMAFEHMKTARLETRIGDLLKTPYSRLFERAHQATEYSTLLKTKLLPRMKQLITGHAAHQKTETVEF